MLDHQADDLETVTEHGITECDYGQWQGRALKDLAQEPLWSVVQTQPSAAVFPGGESLAAMQARCVEAVRRHDAQVAARHGADAVWAAVSHGDVIKSVLADALGCTWTSSSASSSARRRSPSSGTGRAARRSWR